MSWRLACTRRQAHAGCDVVCVRNVLAAASEGFDDNSSLLWVWYFCQKVTPALNAKFISANTRSSLIHPLLNTIAVRMLFAERIEGRLGRSQTPDKAARY